MKQPTLLCSCILCKKQTSDMGIMTHFLRSHGTNEQKQLFANNYHSKLSAAAKEKYSHNPKKCKECNAVLAYEYRVNTFCSHTCSAICSNQRRNESGWTVSDEQKLNVSQKLINYNISQGNKVTSMHETIKTAAGEFSRVYFMKCKFCNDSFTAITTTQVCTNCQHLKWNNNKDQYAFRFNVFDYPALFNLAQLTSIGWVAFGGKRGGKKNIHGLSRDHRVSVNDAKKFNYDPYYISHLMNCELMTHTANSKKKTKSSITYTELVLLVDDYDRKQSV